jgi:hypothetical protein
VERLQPHRVGEGDDVIRELLQPVDGCLLGGRAHATHVHRVAVEAVVGTFQHGVEVLRGGHVAVEEDERELARSAPVGDGLTGWEVDALDVVGVCGGCHRGETAPVARAVRSPEAKPDSETVSVADEDETGAF